MVKKTNRVSNRLVKNLASYYRANPHRFVADYLHINLKVFQKILIYMMNRSTIFCFIASRGLGKTFLVAIFCCVRCILYPGTKICLCAGTRDQAINILEKINSEIRPNSPGLVSELDGAIRLDAAKAGANFHNGSMIKVVTASDSARGNRANVLIIDEFRMVKKSVIDAVLKKFLTAPRHPGYLDKPQYKHMLEQNRQMYLSSAYFKDHWSFGQTKSVLAGMVNDTKRHFVCGIPYHLAIKEGLAMREEIEDQMCEPDYNEVIWDMEMCGIWFGNTDGSWFDFDSIAATRKIKQVMLPDELSSLLPGNKHVRIVPKSDGELRLLSADIALMQSSGRKKNDATAIFINQLVPIKGSRYVSNFVYTESSEGQHTEDVALRIRKLFDEYICDYIVLDANNSGFGIYDALIRDMTDRETGQVYPALSCFNDPAMASRCKAPDAKKAIWSIKATSQMNSEIAYAVRDGYRSGRIRLLINEFDADDMFKEDKEYRRLTSQDKMRLQLPYIETTLAVNETISLQHDIKDKTVRLFEKRSMRKDRFSSIGYSYYVALKLEESLMRGTVDLSGSDNGFLFRAPKQIKETKGGF